MEPLLDDHLQRHLADLLPVFSANQRQSRELVENLPRLTEHELISLGLEDTSCPICFTPFLALLAEEEVALAMDSPAFPSEDLGVTRLTQCGHVFCRRDISRWIRDAHESCPTCRQLFVSSPRDTSQNVSQVAELLFFGGRVQRIVRGRNAVNERNDRSEFRGMYS